MSPFSRPAQDVLQTKYTSVGDVLILPHIDVLKRAHLGQHKQALVSNFGSMKVDRLHFSQDC